MPTSCNHQHSEPLRPRPFLRGLLLLAFCFAASTTAELALDRTVATVNGHLFTLSDLEREAKLIQRLNQQSPPLRQVLDRMIQDELQWTLAEQRGLVLSDLELQQAIRSIQRREELSPKAFRAELASKGVSEAQFRTVLKRQMTITRLQQQTLGNRVTVSDAETASFIEAHPKAFSKEPTRYRLNHILITFSSEKEQLTAHAKALDLVQQLEKSPDRFGLLARSFSEDGVASQGGDLGFRTLQQLPDFLANIAPQLIKKAVRGPILTSNGYHIVQLADKKEPSTGTLREQVVDHLYEQKYQARLKYWLRQLINQAHVEIFWKNPQ